MKFVTFYSSTLLDICVKELSTLLTSESRHNNNVRHSFKDKAIHIQHMEAYGPLLVLILAF